MRVVWIYWIKDVIQIPFTCFFLTGVNVAPRNLKVHTWPASVLSFCVYRAVLPKSVLPPS